MTKLVNEKKIAEDSITYYSNCESFYHDRVKEMMHAGADSVIIKKTLDSSLQCYGNRYILSARLKEIDFSIDSLSKMK